MRQSPHPSQSRPSQQCIRVRTKALSATTAILSQWPSPNPLLESESIITRQSGKNISPSAQGVFTTFVARLKRSPARHSEDLPTALQHFEIIALEKHLSRLTEHHHKSLDRHRHENTATTVIPKGPLQFSTTEIGKLISETIYHTQKWANFQTFRIRLSLFPDSSKEFTMMPFESSKKENICLLPVNLSRVWPDIKSTDITTSSDAYALAKQHGFDDALLIGENQQVLESAWANFFWVDKADNLITPCENILFGVTRSLVLELHHCLQQQYSLAEIMRNAKEAFITKSTSGIIPVRSIGNHVFPQGHKVASELKSRYCALAKSYPLTQIIHESP